MSQVIAHDLDVRTWMWDGKWEKVINHNTLAAIKFFLNHEKELK
jgi:hypothetical protein